MTDQVLDILKLVLLALLYLFFARVLWAVWSEVRQPAANTRQAPDYTPSASPLPGGAGPSSAAGRRQPKPNKGRSGVPARLVVLEPKARAGTTFAIGTASSGIGIGRDADNIIVITDDAFISSHHARITPIEGSVVVEDLGSKNGTYLNGARLSSRRTLSIGDRVQLGYTVLEAQ
ncbi:MAG TPA: FHA domain-containing protein [Ilumatobacter sp.]|nr:FHA domain-containing protein [Ilumatobacter sp.]